MTIFLIMLLYLSDSGVVIVDNVWFYEGDLKSSVLNTGDVVEIIERGDTLYKVCHNDALGRLHKGVLIDLGSEIAEEKLFIFARGYFDEHEYKKSARLFDIFIENFNESKYLAEALFYCGLSYEEIAKSFSKADTLYDIVFNEKTNQWYYSGDVYRTVLEKYPEGIYAAKAAYRLINIFRMKHLPWDDAIQLVKEELTMWQEFISRYKKTEEYVSALLEIGYLNRVLFEMTKKVNYRKDAVKIFQEIIEEYPNSLYSAQSKVNIYEIEKGENIYKY